MSYAVPRSACVSLTPSRRATPRRALSLVSILLAALMAACAGGEGDDTESTNTANDTVTDTGTIANDTGALEDTAGGADDVGEALDTAGPDPDDCPGGPFCPCKEHKECDFGLCISTPDGNVCAKNCIDECPNGYVCRLVNSPGGDTVNICVAKWGKLCNPCSEDKECDSLGIKDSACVEMGSEGSFCGIPCAAGECPSGYACKATFSVAGVKANRCVPTPDAGAAFGTCSCSKAAVAKKLSTTCYIEAKDDKGTVTGKCPGLRKCDEKGLSKCLAPPAEAEKCDGEDNDCDGSTDEATCDDKNPCTQDLCDAKKTLEGKDGCIHNPTQAPCDADGNQCTSNDQCKNGVCTPGKAKDCDDKNPCTKDVCLPASGCTQTDDDGAPCDDDNPCTQSDLCKQGGCEPGIAKKCKSGDPCVLAACDISTGKCKFKPIPDGVPCNDGTACTKADSCLGGTCLGKVVDCDDGSKCTDDSCDSKTGCKHSPNTNPCNDGNACTDADGCKGGKCAGTAKVIKDDCNDGNPCTKDGCNVKTGCTYDDQKGNCSDANPCTTDDTCKDGTCKGGKNTCQCEADKDCNAFEDGDLCNGTLKCDKTASPFKCVVDKHTVVSCSSGKDTACLANKCDKTKGACQFIPKADGKPCDADGDVCSVGDKCKAGNCLAGSQKSCDDNNACTDDSCDKKTGCLHKANTGKCSDGNECTVGDGCSNKVCLSGKKTVCDDKVACTTDSCDPKTGKCVFTGIPGCGGFCATSKDCDDNKVCTSDICVQGKCLISNNSKACDDSNKCTGNDACKDGKCGGSKLDCNDSNECTTDSCKPGVGCINNGHTLACEDGDKCTSGDQCANGTCKPGKGKLCDDGDKCTTDACDPKTGKCGSKAIFGCGGNCADSSHCNDANICTDDKCTNGKCTYVNNKKSCNDGDSCTTGDLCNGGKCTGGDGVEVSTLAGSGVKGYKDDNPKIAMFNGPRGLVVYGGSVLVADRANSVIRKIGAGGLVSTLAGNGKPGYQDGFGKLTAFNRPEGVAVDQAGNIYVADTGNHRIRRITPQGAVLTFAGSGQAGFLNGGSSTARFYTPRGIAVTPLGAAFVADTNTHRIRKVSPDGTVSTLAGSGVATSSDGKGTKAAINRPNAITIASNGDLYFLESSPSSRVRRVTQDGVVTTIAGSGDGVFDGPAKVAKFHNPQGIAVDTGGNIFVADTSNHRVRKISSSLFVSTLIGFAGAGFKDGGPGAAKFKDPVGITVDAFGTLYIGDYGNQRVRLVQDSTGNCNIGGKCYSSGLRKPGSPCLVCAPNKSKTAWSKLAEGTLCQDGSYCTIEEKCNVQGACSGKTKNCDDSNPCTKDSCEAATGACKHAKVVGKCGYCTSQGHCNDGNACTDDACVANQCQYKFNAKPCKSGNPCSVGETCAQGKCVADAAVGVSTIAGGKLGSNDGSINQARFNRPGRIGVATDGTIFVADYYNHRIRKIDQKKALVTTYAGSSSGYIDGKGTQARFNRPFGVDVSNDGTVYVADYYNNRIRKIDKSQNVSTLSGSGASGYAAGSASNARFYRPADVAATLGGVVFVADMQNHMIRKVDAAGNATIVAGSTSYGYKDGKGTAARFRNPYGVDADLNGVVYVADTHNNRLRRIAPDGTVTTLAGGGQGIFDGPVAAAKFYNPYDIAVDGAGRVWVADTRNHRIRRFLPGGTVITVAGSGSYGFVNGSGTNARFRSPYGLDITADGSVYVADWDNYAVRKIFDGDKACSIGGACYANGIANPADPCQRCRGLISSSQWSKTATGGGCNDGKPCVAMETCDAKGVCQGKPAFCDDNNKCTVDSCEAATGQCLFKKKLSHDCFCTSATHCEDNNVCTNDACQNGKCVKTFNNKPCKSGQACSAGDTCSFGSCVALHSVVAGWFCGAGYSGKFADGACNQARFIYPMYMIRSDDGLVYLSDMSWHRIRRIKDGIMQTIAGSGATGLVNGIGSVARFRNPSGIGLDSAGNIIVGDRGNHVIRKVTKTGLVSTFSGTGQAGYVNGPPNLARFNSPAGLHVFPDGGAIVLDEGNRRVRYVAPNGTASWLAGSGGYGSTDGPVATATFGGFRGITVDAKGNIYISQSRNHRVRRIGANGVVTTVLGQGGYGFADGPASQAKINNPFGLAVGPSGELYFADSGNDRIRRLHNGKVTTLAGSSGGYTNGTGQTARFRHPTDLFLEPTGRIVVADHQNHRLRTVWDSKDNCLIGKQCWKSGFGPVKTPCKACQPTVDAKALSNRQVGATCDDDKACTVSACDKAQKCATTPVSCDDNNPCTKDACHAGGICTHTLTNTCDDGDPCTLGESCVNGKCKPELDKWVTAYAGAGYSSQPADGPRFSWRAYYPMNLKLTSDGKQWLFDSSNKVRELKPDLSIKTFAGTGSAGDTNGYTNKARFNHCSDIGLLKGGEYIVTDYNNHRLRKIDKNDYVSTYAGSAAGYADGTLSTARFNRPYKIRVLKGEVMIVLDRGNRGLRKVHNGKVAKYTGCNGYGDTNGPWTVARFRDPVDFDIDSHGNMYVVDVNSRMIRKVHTDRSVTLLAGGSYGFADGKGSAAKFSNPHGIAVGPDSLLYVADMNNHRVRTITDKGVVATFAGSGSQGHVNGAGSSARFSAPIGVHVNAFGDVVVVDHQNHRLRLVRQSVGRCFIGSKCWAGGVVNPSAPCEACNAAASKTGWSAKSAGAACSDGQPCTIKDSCSGGQCKGTTKQCGNGCDSLTGNCQ